MQKKLCYWLNSRLKNSPKSLAWLFFGYFCREVCMGILQKSHSVFWSIKGCPAQLQLTNPSSQTCSSHSTDVSVNNCSTCRSIVNWYVLCFDDCPYGHVINVYCYLCLCYVCKGLFPNLWYACTRYMEGNKLKLKKVSLYARVTNLKKLCKLNTKFPLKTVHFFLGLLYILPCPWVVWHYAVNCWKFSCQHRMYYFENKTGWHLVYEDDAYSLS
jgi:hypothetical protein